MLGSMADNSVWNVWLEVHRGSASASDTKATKRENDLDRYSCNIKCCPSQGGLGS